MVTSSGDAFDWRNRGSKSLSSLTVAALYDVAAMPSLTNGVDHRPRDSLDGNHLLTDGALCRDLARFGVSPVNQNRACCAEPGATAELRAAQLKDVPEDPEERRLRMAVANLDLGAVDR